MMELTVIVSSSATHDPLTWSPKAEPDFGNSKAEMTQKVRESGLHETTDLVRRSCLFAKEVFEVGHCWQLGFAMLYAVD